MLRTRNWMQKEMLLYVESVFIVFVIVGVVAFMRPHTATEGCELGSGITCIDYKVSPSGAVIALKNNMEQEIQIEGAKLGECSASYTNVSVDAGRVTMIAIDGCDLNKEQVMSELELTYRSKGDVSIQTLSGHVVAPVTHDNIFDDYNEFMTNQGNSPTPERTVNDTLNNTVSST